jgi:hypothetical protein
MEDFMKQKKGQDKSPLFGKESFWDGSGASFKGFVDFCGQNTPLLISVTLAAIFIYGVFLFNISVTGDTVLDFSTRRNPMKLNLSGDTPYTVQTDILSLKRWTQWLFASFFYIRESGVYTTNFVAVASVWTFSILFCYFIAVFTKNTNRRNGFIPLALTLLSCPVWAICLPNVYMARTNLLFVAVMLTGVYLLYTGFLSNNKAYIVISFILTVLSLGSYQPLTPLFLCIVFIFFVLLEENSNLRPKEYSFLCLKLFLFFLAAFALRSLVGSIVQYALDIPDGGNYVTGIMIWNKSSLIPILTNILGLGYFTTIGAIPFVHSLFTPLMETMYGSAAGPYGKSIAENVLLYSRTAGNILLLPAGIAFIAYIILNAKNRIPKGRRLLYVLAGFGVPVSIFFLVIVSGDMRGLRILYCLPFASAFMFYYVARRQKPVLRRVFYCLILAASFYQAQVSQNLLEGLARVSEYDTIAAFDVSRRVSEVTESGEKLPLVFIGNRHPFENQIFPSFDVTTRSVFERWSLADMPYQTDMVILFMQMLGFYYDIPTPLQVSEAYEASRDMPAYPEKGCVKNIGDVVVVKMGGDL